MSQAFPSSKMAKAVIATAFAVSLTACGGGGGGGVSSTPNPPTAPPPPPPPPPSTPLSILPNPTPGTFASVGVSASISPDAVVSNISKADADQLHVRYGSDGYYEVQMPGRDWLKLTKENYDTAKSPIYLVAGYNNSELARWINGERRGVVAFGAATPASQLPTSGSATYKGVITGTSDVVGGGQWGPDAVWVEGSVALTFNFAAGSLDGSMTAHLDDYGIITQLGTFDFKNTVYSKGSASYSGEFQTSAQGQNYFFGQFTGPNAQETIGAWALPFTYDGAGHQAFGAWIAKQ